MSAAEHLVPAASITPAPAFPVDPLAPATIVPPTLRLPTGARPLRYAVELTLSPDTDAFSGTVDIEMEIDRSLSVLWLNADDVTVSEASMTFERGSPPGAPATADHDPVTHPDSPATPDGTPLHLRVVPGGADFVGFAFEEPVGPGRATLHLAYSGAALAKESRGIFRRKEGADWYLFTQFESTGARRAFPCFDEPGLKAPWRIALTVPNDLAAVSNAPLASESNSREGWKTLRFAQTQPLPSYLVAFAVGPFEFVEGRPAGSKGVPFRVVTPRGLRAQAAYALETTPEMLPFLEAYFGSPYPFDKLDLIAVPGFGGAMENPGLITFGRGLLLTKPQEETIGRQRRFSTVLAHELAHMWFGDLVTLAWWNDIWLNESFANWMESKIVEQWKPGWEVPLQRVRRRNRAMGTDSLVSARRVRQPIESKDDIENAFDAITYDKGSSVLAMFEGWIGAEPFRRGVQRYLSRHAWGSAAAEDFFEVLSEEAGLDVAPTFSSFLDQGGVPLVTETLSCPPDSRPSLKLSQSRYLPVGSRGSPQQTWKIPVCLRYGAEGGEQRRCLLLDDASTEVALEGPCPTWLVPNEGTAGYFRTRIVPDTKNAGAPGIADGPYSPSSSSPFDFTARLFARGDTHLTGPEKVGLLDDLSSLVESGAMSAKDVLSLLPAVVRDGSRSSFEAAIRITKDLRPHLVPDPLLSNYQRFVAETFGAKARELGFEAKRGESEDARLLRPAVVSLAATWGEDPRLQKRARALAMKWLRDPRSLDTDMVDVVLVAAARHGDEALFERFLTGAKAATDRTERRRRLDAVAEFQDPALVRRRLPLMLSNQFDAREAMTLLRGTLDEPRTNEIVLGFIETNYSALAEKLPKSSEARLATVAFGFCDATHRGAVESFFKDRMAHAVGGPRLLAELLEEIDLCIARKHSQQPGVAEFLGDY